MWLFEGPKLVYEGEAGRNGREAVEAVEANKKVGDSTQGRRQQQRRARPRETMGALLGPVEAPGDRYTGLAGWLVGWLASWLSESHGWIIVRRASERREWRPTDGLKFTSDALTGGGSGLVGVWSGAKEREEKGAKCFQEETMRYCYVWIGSDWVGLDWIGLSTAKRASA